MALVQERTSTRWSIDCQCANKASLSSSFSESGLSIAHDSSPSSSTVVVKNTAGTFTTFSATRDQQSTVHVSSAKRAIAARPRRGTGYDRSGNYVYGQGKHMVQLLYFGTIRTISNTHTSVTEISSIQLTPEYLHVTYYFTVYPFYAISLSPSLPFPSYTPSSY